MTTANFVLHNIIPYSKTEYYHTALCFMLINVKVIIIELSESVMKPLKPAPDALDD
jgi:hypothetical protein